MALRRAALLLLGLAAACHPSVRGRCTIDTDCRAGSSCTPDGLCVNAPRPSVQVVLQPGSTVAPSAPRVVVRVTASPQLTLGMLSVVAVSGRTLASGALDSSASGDNTVTLTHFEPDAVGQVAVTATLHFSAPGGAADAVNSDAAVAAIDTQAPAVNVFIPATSDMVNGWVARTSGTLEVQAQVDDGAGSGAASASLTLDHCPSAAPCSYVGAVVSRPSAGAATFSFAVPRAVQAVGSEAPVTGAVVALDRVQNSTRKVVSLQIDDAPPALGPVTLVTAGVQGEDGHSWFPGGARAAAVEIAVAASDHGAGLLDLSLHLEPADVAADTADPASAPNADGSFHFKLPAAAVIGREGSLRFSLFARDALHNAASLPGSPATSVWIDDVPPTVTLASVNYGSTLPTQTDVCSSDPNVICGRGPALAPDHLLRDDVATVTFAAYDCGAGLATSGGAAINGLDAALSSSSGSPCATSSNPIHHYTLQLDISLQMPAAPDLNGNEKLSLDSDALDFLGHRTDNLNGSALISIVRWRSQLGGSLSPSPSPSGSPALLPIGSPRQVVIGTNVAAGNSLFILDPQGGVAQAKPLSRLSSDVAVDKLGVVYAVGIDSNTSPTQLSMFDSTTPAIAAVSCTISDVTIGVAPVLAGAADAPPLAVLAATNATGLHNVYVYDFQKACDPADKELLTLDAQATFLGASANANKLFFGHAAGFTSIQLNQTFVQAKAVSYNSTSGNPAASGGPAISFDVGTSVENPIFAGGDKKVRDTKVGPCTPSSCWQQIWASLPAPANPLIGTPVFDGNNVYVTDSKGIVYAFSQGSGAWQGQVAPATSASSISVSLPVLVGVGQALVVQRDATVRLVTPTAPVASNAITLLQMKTQEGLPASYGSTPVPIIPTPVVDVRGSGGVAYIPDGAGWVWAVQLDQAPVAASATAWPRPGRDTCNSRNASASCP